MSKFVVILINLFYILMVSAIGALPSLFWGLSLTNYLAVFAILTAAQLFIGKVWNYFIDRRIRLRMEQVNAANALADAVQHVNVVCAYCGTGNLAKIYVGEEENTYECTACHETNAVLIQTSSVRVTKPIMPKAELADIFKNIDKKD